MFIDEAYMIIFLINVLSIFTAWPPLNWFTVHIVKRNLNLWMLWD